MNRCIFCNTQADCSSMQVKTKNASHVAWYCQTCEDLATPKKVREIIEKREADLAEFEAKAKEMGYTLTPMGGGGIVAVAAPTDTPAPAPQVAAPTPKVQSTETRLDPRQRPAARKIRDVEAPTQAVDPAGRNVPLEKHAVYDTTQKVTRKDGTQAEAPKSYVEEAQTIVGRGGAEIAIPKRVVGDSGTTDIAIIDNGGDAALQKNFKSLSEGSKKGQGPDFRSGYSVRECGFCKGTGIARITKSTCPKCGGKGSV